MVKVGHFRFTSECLFLIYYIPSVCCLYIAKCGSRSGQQKATKITYICKKKLTKIIRKYDVFEISIPSAVESVELSCIKISSYINLQQKKQIFILYFKSNVLNPQCCITVSNNERVVVHSTTPVDCGNLKSDLLILAFEQIFLLFFNYVPFLLFYSVL